MFRLVMEDAKNMKNIVDAVVNIIDEGPVEINEEGLFLRAIDPSQIAMISLKIPKLAFTEYTVESPSVIGVNFSQLSKIMNRAKTGEKFVMSSDGSTLIVEFLGAHKHRTFKIPLIETHELIRKELSIEPEATVSVEAGELKESLKDVGLISTYLTFVVDKNGFVIDVKGDTGNLQIEMPGNSLSKFEVKNKARASFSLQYMESIVKACPDHQNLTLYIKTDMPLKVEYNIDDAEIVYFLAPRKEEYE